MIPSAGQLLLLDYFLKVTRAARHSVITLRLQLSFSNGSKWNN